MYLIVGPEGSDDLTCACVGEERRVAVGVGGVDPNLVEFLCSLSSRGFGCRVSVDQEIEHVAVLEAETRDRLELCWIEPDVFSAVRVPCKFERLLPG